MIDALKNLYSDESMKTAIESMYSYCTVEGLHTYEGYMEYLRTVPMGFTPTMILGLISKLDAIINGVIENTTEQPIIYVKEVAILNHNIVDIIYNRIKHILIVNMVSGKRHIFFTDNEKLYETLDNLYGQLFNLVSLQSRGVQRVKMTENGLQHKYNWSSDDDIDDELPFIYAASDNQPPKR